MGAKSKIEKVAIHKLVDYLFEDPETRFPKIMDRIDTVAPANLYPRQRAVIRNEIDRRSNWYELMLRIAHLNPWSRLS